jgi:predicted permease
MDRVKSDLRYALRQVRRAPITAVVASISVATGIIVAVLAFSFVNAVLLKPLPVPDSHRIVHVYTSDGSGRDRPYGSSSYADFQDIAATGLFDGLTASGWRQLAVAASDGPPRNEFVSFVAPEYVSVLGVPLIRGRGFSAGGREAEIIITENYWARVLHRDPAVPGRTLRVNGTVLTVVGVASARFRGTALGPPFIGWLPAPLLPAVAGEPFALVSRGARGFQIVGRLATGQKLEQATPRLDALAAALARQYPDQWIDDHGESRLLSVLSHRQSLAPPGQRAPVIAALIGFVGLVSLVLLLVCTNVAGLLLARALSRQHEVAVRLSLGATRSRLLAQLMVENLLLGAIGGALGVLAVQWLSSFAGHIALLDGFDLQPDWRVLLLAFVLTVLCALLFGLAPAAHSLRADLRSGLSAPIASAARARLRGAMIVMQVAVSCVLVLLALMAARGVRSHLRIEPGIAIDNLLIARLEAGPLARDSLRESAYVHDVLELTRDLPGVLGAALTTMLPFGGTTRRAEVIRPDGRQFITEWNDVSADYFETVGLRPTDGRVTGAADRESAAPLAVVSREFARAWGAPVTGRVIDILGQRGVRIIGVVDEVRYHQRQQQPLPMIYRVREHSLPSRTEVCLLARVRPAEEAAVAAALQRRMRAQFPDAVLPTIQPMSRYLAERPDILVQRIGARVALGVSAVELALATVGLYGLLLFALVARTRELGVRLALGASPRRAGWAVMRSGVYYVLVGAAGGLLLAVPLVLVTSRAMLGVRPADPLPFAVTLACVLAVCALAALLPARRAARIQPAAALRHD